LKGAPVVKFDPDQIEILLRVSWVSILVVIEDNQVFDCFSGANSAWTNKERASK
jgi:hypothetical protein